MSEASMRDVQRMYPFELIALCLLPDYLHILVTLPEADANYSVRLRAIKGNFTKLYLLGGGQQGIRNVSRKKRGEAAIWQRRFREHDIRDEKDQHKHPDYIH
jgi:putative transposase